MAVVNLDELIDPDPENMKFGPNEAARAAAINSGARPITTEAKDKPSVRIQRVTPDLAEKWLGFNEHNRSNRESHASYLIGIVERGEFQLIGDCITFDTEGYLINGQHRLTACWVAQKPIDVVVLRGIPASSQDVMDKGLKRNMADTLKLRGYTDVTNLSATLSWIHRLNYILDQPPPQAVSYAAGIDRPSPKLLLDILEGHGEEERELIIQMVKQAHRVQQYADVKFRVSICAVLWYTFYKIQPIEADMFWDAVSTGEMLKKTDPIYAMRRALSNATQGFDNSMQDYRECAMLIKTWNYWRNSQEARAIHWKYSPSSKDPFPFPK